MTSFVENEGFALAAGPVLGLRPPSSLGVGVEVLAARRAEGRDLWTGEKLKGRQAREWKRLYGVKDDPEEWYAAKYAAVYAAAGLKRDE